MSGNERASAWHPWWPLALALLVGLALRLLLWERLPRAGLISDEGEYLAAATWLAQGRGFSWHQGYLWTRAPLYPLFVAAHIRAFGQAEAAFVTQSALGLLTVALVYWLSRAMNAPARAPGLAALLAALSLPLATYHQVLLSETLFITLLLAAFLALTHWQRGLPKAGVLPLLIAALLLGLATLTRSLALGFLPIAVLWSLWAAWSATGSIRRGIAAAALLAACAGSVVLPWTLYNSTRLYGGLILVDTTGAFNTLLGAQTAYDGKRTDAATRDKVLALLAPVPPPERIERLRQAAGCTVAGDAEPPLLRKERLSQADRQQFMVGEALCLIQARPVAFATKSLAELFDLLRINYSGDERFSSGFAAGRLPPWYALALFLLDDTLYIIVLPLAVLGFTHARGLPGRGLLGLWLAYNMATAPLLFAINRFRLPLLPVAFVFAAIALASLTSRLPARERQPRSRPVVVLAAVLWLVAATPYAYLEPLPANTDSRWASYLGFYPSSLASTRLALANRERFLRGEALRTASSADDSARAQALLAAGGLDRRDERAGYVALLASQGRHAEALTALPATSTLNDIDKVQVSVLQGDLLRSLGQETAAKAAMTPEFVDSANPVEWAWGWLRPAPTRRIDLGGNLDLGYIRGCYLGEGDRTLTPPATFRWCTDGAQLRFPAAGTGQPQTLSLRVDGRGWPTDLLPVTPATVVLDGRAVGQFDPAYAAVTTVTLLLPPTPAGAEVLLTLRSPTFVPNAADYLSQQGNQAGQLRRLAVRLDEAALSD